MTDTSEETVPDLAVGHGRRVGLAIAAVWLVFLISAIGAAWSRGPLNGTVGTSAAIAFAALYLVALAWVRGPLGPVPGSAPRFGRLASVFAVMVALTAVLCWAAGEAGLTCVPYLAIVAVFGLPVSWGWRAGIVIAVAGFGTSLLIPDWHPQGGVLFGGGMATLAAWGIRRMVRVRAENTKLLMDRQRDRFARDLHDILGHSLTVITVKAELAQKLFDIDPERARAEIADLERLSRDALTDVRRAVAGYREITLPGELANARAALEAAEITPLLPQSTESVPTPVRELFAWTVREGVTNVIRHAAATECEILLESGRVVVRDNGRGATVALGGHGLTGLRERAAAVGATVTTRNLTPGFVLEVST